MRTWSSLTCSVMLMVGSALPAYAISNVTEYNTNWDNYRTCDADAPGPLATCAEEDVRSPSRYYLPDGSQGTLQYSSSGAVKFRMDTISVDTTGTSCNSSYNVQFGTCTYPGNTVDCFANPPRIGHCSGSGTDNCCNDGHCLLPACNQGPHADARCTTVSTCTNTASSTQPFKLVFTGVANGAAPVPGFFPWSYYKLLGDSTGVGCTKTCTFTLSGSNPQINSSDISSNCTLAGDCTGDPNFYDVKILDPDGEILAVPTRGTAKLQTSSYVVNGDPAKEGDYCRNQSPPPANCPP